ncbi:MAG: hypothetical protein QXU18_13240 [Thermoplasmatales archaeon]
MENKKKFLKLMTLAIIAVMVATIGMGTLASAQPANTELNLPFISNPANTTLNVTLSQISYITQPTQWIYSGNSQQKAYYSNGTAWVVPNSGYLFIANNSTTSTAPPNSYINFPVGTSLGSTISYMFADSRMSFNGTGETAYYMISEGNQTAAPSTAGNVLKASAGAAQNVVDVIISEHNATTSTVSVGYFADSDGVAYQNYTTYSFSSIYLNALQWYDFMIYIQSTGTTVSIMNTTGSVIATSSVLPAVLDGNYSKITTITYMSSEAASTAGDMLILDYSYIVDHNTYQIPAPLAGAIGNVGNSVAPFDPGASSVSNYTQSPSSSGSFLSTNISSSDFTSITNSSTTAAINSGMINASLETQTNDTQVLSPSALTDVRVASAIPSSITTNLYVTSWTSSGINASINQYLQNTIGTLVGVNPSDVTIIGYVVTQIGLNINLSNSTMTEVGNYLDNAIPGLLQANNLSLVDSATGAIQAGAMAGYFMGQYGPVAPVIKGNLITDPFTGDIYSSLAQAGFPTGSYIFEGAITVPQWQFLGFASDGQPVFSNVPLAWNPFASLTGAAKAVNNFFHSAASTVTNAIKPVTSTASTVGSKIESTFKQFGDIGGAVQKFTTDVSKATNNVMPFLGGAVGTLGKDITGTVTHVAQGIDSGLADVKGSVTGAILSGVSDVKQGISSIGSAVSTKLTAAGNTIYTTLGKVGTTVKNVISPIVTSIKNLPTAIVNGTKTLAKDATSFGQSIASDASHLGIAIKNGTMNALDTIGNTVTSAGKEVFNAFGNVSHAIVSDLKAPFSFAMGLSNNVAHIVEYAAIGIVVVLLVIVGVYVFSHEKGGRRSRSRSRRKR